MLFILACLFACLAPMIGWALIFRAAWARVARHDAARKRADRILSGVDAPRFL